MAYLKLSSIGCMQIIKKTQAYGTVKISDLSSYFVGDLISIHQKNKDDPWEFQDNIKKQSSSWQQNPI